MEEKNGLVLLRPIFWFLWLALLIGLASANPATSKLRGRVYLNNYITAIEDDSTEPAGFMVTTADSNYAIFSPRFEPFGWLSVTVNEGQVFIVSNSSSSYVKQLAELDEEERDLIAEVRANFVQSLTGLKLSRAVASDSLLLLSNKLAYANSAYSTSSKTDNLKLSQAEQAIHLMESVSQLGEGQEKLAKELSSADEDSRPVVRENSKEGGGGGGPPMRSARLRKLRGSLARASKSRARGYALDYAKSSDSGESPSDEGYQSSGLGFCSRKTQPHLSYHNLLGSSQKDSLSGDVYNFDLRCNILDVYSSSVSISQAAGLSVLYRDENYFAYSRFDLPRHINRFFLISDKIFFVYHDRSLLLKHDWLLDPLELEVVIGSRRQLRVESSQRANSATLTSGTDEEGDTNTEQASGNGASRRAGSGQGAPARGKQ